MNSTPWASIQLPGSHFFRAPPCPLLTCLPQCHSTHTMCLSLPPPQFCSSLSLPHFKQQLNLRPSTGPSEPAWPSPSSAVLWSLVSHKDSPGPLCGSRVYCRAHSCHFEVVALKGRTPSEQWVILCHCVSSFPVSGCCKFTLSHVYNRFSPATVWMPLRGEECQSMLVSYIVWTIRRLLVSFHLFDILYPSISNFSSMLKLSILYETIL